MAVPNTKTDTHKNKYNYQNNMHGHICSRASTGRIFEANVPFINLGPPQHPPPPHPLNTSTSTL